MLALPWPVKRIALMHMSINLTVVALYVVNIYLRRRGVHGVAVETPPHPAAPPKHHLGT